MSTPAVTAPGRGLWRWFVALIATVLLVVAGSGLVVFAANGEAEGKGPQWVAAGAPIYIDIRIDMPGDQGENVAQMLSAFPGLADSGSFDLKTDELIDELVESATGGALSYSGEIEDIITGEIGLALPDLTSAIMGGSAMAGSEDPPILIGIAHSDREAAESFMSLMTAAADDMTEEAYGDTVIMSDPTTAAAVHDEWILLSQSADVVKTGVDTLEGSIPSLADDPAYQAAVDRLPSPRLGSAYVDYASFGSLIDLAGMMAAGETGMEMPTTDLLAALPQNLIASLSAEPDRMHLDAFVTHGEATPVAVVGESDLASLFPADTQIYGETRQLGAAVQAGLEQVAVLLESQAESGAMSGAELEQIEVLFSEDSPITSMLGVPLPEFFDFLGDTAVGGGLTSDGIDLGIAAVVEDEATAAVRVERLISIVRLAAASGESGIEIETVTIDDSDATAITLPAEAMAETGLPFPIDDTVTIAVADGYLLIGLGDFVETALTQDSVDSLQASAGYTDALAGDVPNSGVTYVNVSEMLTSIDPLLSLMMPEWAEVQPYATAVDRAIAVGTSDEDVTSARVTVIVGQ